jgi:hypothetical protein
MPRPRIEPIEVAERFIFQRLEMALKGARKVSKGDLVEFLGADMNDEKYQMFAAEIRRVADDVLERLPGVLTSL